MLMAPATGACTGQRQEPASNGARREPLSTQSIPGGAGGSWGAEDSWVLQDPAAGPVALARICQPLSRPYPRYSMYL